MPCDDERDSPRYIYPKEVEPLRRRVRELEAMLCAVLRAYPRISKGTSTGLILSIDEKESGIKRERLMQWWNKHQEEDRQRKAKERIASARKEAKEKALAKLTLDERKLLGIRV